MKQKTLIKSRGKDKKEKETNTMELQPTPKLQKTTPEESKELRIVEIVEICDEKEKQEKSDVYKHLIKVEDGFMCDHHHKKRL